MLVQAENEQKSGISEQMELAKMDKTLDWM